MFMVRRVAARQRWRQLAVGQWRSFVSVVAQAQWRRHKISGGALYVGMDGGVINAFFANISAVFNRRGDIFMFGDAARYK
jgi:hypothetical protein